MFHEHIYPFHTSPVSTPILEPQIEVPLPFPLSDPDPSMTITQTTEPPILESTPTPAVDQNTPTHIPQVSASTEPFATADPIPIA